MTVPLQASYSVPRAKSWLRAAKIATCGLWDVSRLFGSALGPPAAQPHAVIDSEKPGIQGTVQELEKRKVELENKRSVGQLNLAMELEKDGKLDFARERYKKIVKEYPGTTVAE